MAKHKKFVQPGYADKSKAAEEIKKYTTDKNDVMRMAVAMGLKVSVGLEKSSGLWWIVIYTEK